MAPAAGTGSWKCAARDSSVRRVKWAVVHAVGLEVAAREWASVRDMDGWMDGW
ncbi:hypothetical protein BC567DRAFT_235424 [Phyllosticta citribraziliensis]